MEDREYNNALFETVTMLYSSLEEARGIIYFYQEKYEELKKELSFYRKIENGKKRNKKEIEKKA